MVSWEPIWIIFGVPYAKINIIVIIVIIYVHKNKYKKSENMSNYE